MSTLVAPLPCLLGLHPRSALGSRSTRSRRVCSVTACRSQAEQHNSREYILPAQPNTRRSNVTDAPSTGFRLHVALGWALLLPLTLCMLPMLARPQPRHQVVSATAIVLPSAHQPAANADVQPTVRRQLPIYQSAFASISLSSFGHFFRQVHAAHFAKVLTYQAQRVSRTCGFAWTAVNTCLGSSCITSQHSL